MISLLDDYNEAWVGGKAPKKKRVYKIKGKKYTLKKTLKKRLTVRKDNEDKRPIHQYQCQ